jgi:hypothetical protein
MILSLLEELTGKYLFGAIPEGFSSTRNIRKPGDVGNSNFCTFTQNYNGLISSSFKIPAYAYCQPLGCIRIIKFKLIF